MLGQPEHLAALIEHSLRQVKDYLYRRNQPHQARQNLRARYAEYYTNIRELLRNSTQIDEFARQLEAITTEHVTHLAVGLQQEIVAHAASCADYRAYLETVTCAEYSPEQQLAMLGIVDEDLQPPVLDLGCGAQAALCQYLNERDIEVLGIDRLAPDLPFCRRSGWDEFAYQEATWGTIISHHAFSTHFHFHHRHSEAKAMNMAALFMNILNSLQPGGVFIYTPGLPFIEPFIAETGRFDLQTVAIADAPLHLQAIAYAGHTRRKFTHLNAEEYRERDFVYIFSLPIFLRSVRINPDIERQRETSGGRQDEPCETRYTPGTGDANTPTAKNQKRAKPAS